MTSSRTRYIEALEHLRLQCIGAIAKGIAVNQLILERKLPVPPIDMHSLHLTLQASEKVLRDVELSASGAVQAAGMTA